MKIITPKFEIIEQEAGLEGIWRHIEMAGRTCYKSQSEINDSTALKFVDRMVASGHGSVLEHGTVYLSISDAELAGNEMLMEMLHTLDRSPYSRVNYSHDTRRYSVTTNLRVLVENGMDELMDTHICEPTKHHDRRVTVRFSLDLGLAREYNRHRVHSISEESTRYCNYAKEKFGSELAIVCPPNLTDEDIQTASKAWAADPGDDKGLMLSILRDLVDGKEQKLDAISTWLMTNLVCQWAYCHLIQLGWKAQEARALLPLDTATESVHTAYLGDWRHFFDLRALGTTGAPHPSSLKLAIPLYEEFKRRNLI